MASNAALAAAVRAKVIEARDRAREVHWGGNPPDPEVVVNVAAQIAPLAAAFEEGGCDAEASEAEARFEAALAANEALRNEPALHGLINLHLNLYRLQSAAAEVGTLRDQLADLRSKTESADRPEPTHEHHRAPEPPLLEDLERKIAELRKDLAAEVRLSQLLGSALDRQEKIVHGLAFIGLPLASLAIFIFHLF